MKEMVFFLEEPSAKAMLECVLPRLLPDDIIWRAVVFEGKQDLENRIVKRMRGYLNPRASFIVLRDKDSADCHFIKQNLKEKCVQVYRAKVLIRIACHELESWYLADLAAVEKGMQVIGLKKMQPRELYRDPDSKPKPSLILKKLVPSYQKVEGSRAISEYLNLENTRSPSFKNFVSGIRKLIAEKI